MKQKRRQYTQEFKEEAVKLITEQGYRISEASRNLSINENMLGRWKQELTQEKTGSYSDVKNKKEMESEIRRLEKENKRLRMERETLCANLNETEFCSELGKGSKTEGAGANRMKNYIHCRIIEL